MVEKVTRDLKWVKTLDADMLACRSLRHSWETYTFKKAEAEDLREMRRPDWANQFIQRTLTCIRCHAVRIDYFGRSGSQTRAGGRFEKFNVRYVYPKGYTFKKTEHELARPVASDYNWELFRRT